MTEHTLGQLLIAIASGLSVSETRKALPEATDDDLREALAEALAQGIEREDVSPSFFRL